MAKLRLTIVVDSLDHGGAERQAAMLARHLVGDPVLKVELLSLRRADAVNEPHHTLVHWCDTHGVPWRCGPMPLGPSWHEWQSAVPGVARALRAGRPDVLLPYTARPNFYCALLWRQIGARTCIWQQRDAGLYRPPARWERLAALNTPWFVANSSASAGFLLDTLDVPRQSVTTIANGVDPEPAIHGIETWRASLQIGAGDVAACMVANLTEAKDHATLLSAWAEVLRARPTSAARPVLVLAGYRGSTAAALEAQASTLGIASWVRFAGPVQDVTGLIQAMDLCVHSSRSEGLPNGVLECMAVGLPVVGTDLPGLREALGEGAPELLAPPGDSSLLAERLLRLIYDPGLRQALGSLNRRRIADRFGPGRVASQTLAVVAAALAQDRVPGIGTRLLTSRPVLTGLRGLSRAAWSWRQ